MADRKINDYYCEKCKRLSNVDECPFCGNIKTRKAKENDAVFLMIKAFVYARMFEDVLEKNSIPYLKQSYGVTMYTRNLTSMGDYKFFVPYGAYEKAKAIMDELFFYEDDPDNTIQ